MKKILSLALTLLLTMSLISTASAVEIIDTQNNTPKTDGNWELCSWLLDEDGKLVAQKYREADTILPINETSTTIAGIVGNGKVERAHARHLVTLDERRWVDVGDSEPVWCKVEFLELDDGKAQAEFAKFAVTNCEELEDQLTEAFEVDTTPEGEKIFCAYYRAVEIKLEETELDVEVVARVYVGENYFHVLLVDYDQDGKRELCLHLGLLPTAKSTEDKKDNTTTGGTDFTIGGEEEKNDTTNGGTDFTIGGSDSTTGGTDFTIGGSSSNSNSSDNKNHNGWSDALTNNGSSAKTESTDSTSGGTGFTIQ